MSEKQNQELNIEELKQNRQEVIVEALAEEATAVGDLKTAITTEAFSLSGGLLKTTKVFIKRLSCGHFAKSVTKVAVCSCQRTLCSSCSQESGKCNNCGRALCKKCRRESWTDPNIFNCRRCRWFSWIKKIF